MDQAENLRLCKQASVTSASKRVAARMPVFDAQTFDTLITINATTWVGSIVVVTSYVYLNTGTRLPSTTLQATHDQAHHRFPQNTVTAPTYPV